MKLQDIMNEKDISQYYLGKKSGVSQSHISRILSGQCQPGLSVLQKLAGALGVSLIELISETDEQAATLPKTG